MSQVTDAHCCQETERRELFQAEVALRQWLAEYYGVYQPVRGEAIDKIIEQVCDLLDLPRPSGRPGGQSENYQTVR